MWILFRNGMKGEDNKYFITVHGFGVLFLGLLINTHKENCMNETMLCRVCRDRKPISEFYKGHMYKDGYNTACKSCILKYDREREARHLGPRTTGTKKCCHCKEERPVSDFTKRLRNRDGLRSRCKYCDRASEKAYRLENPNSSRLAKVRQVYGLNADEYIQLLTEHDNKCRICKSDKRLGVDHCHKTGKVRGILCTRCNTGLGMFGDNINSLINSIEYLKEHEQKQILPTALP